MTLIADRALLWRTGRHTLTTLALGCAAGAAAGLVNHAPGVGLLLGSLIGALAAGPLGDRPGTLLVIGSLSGLAYDQFALGALIGVVLDAAAAWRRARRRPAPPA